jgi:hypothetical protein
MRETLTWFALLNFDEQFDEQSEVRDGHVSELSFVKLVDRFIELLEQLEALRGDASFDHAAIILLTMAGNQGLFFQAIEQSRHVRIVANHTLGDATAQQAVGFGAAQDTQNVVLRGGKAGGFDGEFGLLREPISGFEDGDEELGLEGDGGANGHGLNIVVITTVVKSVDWKIEKGK